jgi:hypothetical protein
MKSLVNRIAMLAAGAMVLGTMAYGQTQLTARIPFAFHTGTSSFAAGDYTIANSTMNGGNTMVTLRNAKTHETVFVGGGINDLWNTGSPAAVFRCSDDGGCALKAIRTPAKSITYSTARKHARDKEAAVHVIALRPVTAD